MWLRKRQKGRFRLDPEYFADTRSNWRWQCENVHRDSTAQRLILAEETLDDTKVALHQNAVEYAHMRWVGRIAKFTEVEIQELISSREVLHPLIPLVIFWLKEAYVSPVDPDRRPSGILPAPFARRAEAELLPHLLIGLYVGPKRIQLPRHGRVTVLERLVVELILSVPQKNRPKTRKRKGKVDSDSDDVVAQFALDFQVKEIVDWLQWSKAAYRRTGATTGKLLRRVIEDELSNIRLPIGPRGGGLYPCRMVFASGWTLRDRVAFSVTLPSGSYVGPPVDRQMLRDLGGDGPAWRAYLSLCCYWDRHGGKGGRLIRPMRPIVVRNTQGHLVNAKGKVIMSETDKHRPATNAFDPRAVRTGEWEINPARTRYPAQDEDGMLHMSYPRRLGQDYDYSLANARKAVREYKKRSRMALERVEEKGGCYIEKLGQENGKFLWRIMPPHRADADCD